MALAGQFRFDGNGEGLLARFGAISTLQGIHYWSVSDHQWRTLITHASALDSPDLTRQRADFTTAEMKRGRKFYFAHDDNRTSGEVIYRLRVQELTLDRLVVTTENVSPVRKLMLRLAEPGVYNPYISSSARRHMSGATMYWRARPRISRFCLA